MVIENIHYFVIENSIMLVIEILYTGYVKKSHYVGYSKQSIILVIEKSSY